MLLTLDDRLEVEVTYSVEDDEIIVSNIEITEGTIIDLLNYFTDQGFDSTIEHLADKVNDKLLTAYGEDETDDEENI